MEKNNIIQGSFPKSDGFNQSEYQSKSVFTLLIYFRNGYKNGVKFHSYKQEKRKIDGVYITDERYAFNRLMFLIETEYKDKYKTAIMYHNPTNTELCKFAYGQCKDRIPLQWGTSTEGNVTFVMQETTIANMQQRMLKLQDSKFYKY